MASSSKRHPSLITIRRGGTLADEHHRLLASWSADCAERVLHYFEADRPEDSRPREAIEGARDWAKGEIKMQKARELAWAAHAAAREEEGPAREAARAAGHAVSVAHMADHALGGAIYAIRAVRAASTEAERDAAGRAERDWQRQILPEAIRALVLEDQKRRSRLLWGLFDD